MNPQGPAYCYAQPDNLPLLCWLLRMDRQIEMDGQPPELEEPEREPTPWASDSDWEEWKRRLPGRVGAEAGHPAKPPEPWP